MCVYCGIDSCHYGEYCVDSYYGLSLEPGSLNYMYHPVIESEYMSKDSVAVSIEEAPAKAASIIKKQSEVWVYDDEVYASYSKALAASLKATILEPMCRAFYERSGYSHDEIARSVAAQKKQKFKSFVFYADDIIASLPIIIEAVKDAEARKD